MSAQFGRWNFDDKPVAPSCLEKVKAVIASYGPDGGGCYAKDNVGILYQAFHTTAESRDEIQPHILATGVVITWDGRLDNRAELIGELSGPCTVSSTDVEIVAAAYERWGTDCLPKLLGDWALAVWNTRAQSLILAKDFVGVRHLYYSIDKDGMSWSTILDPLILPQKGLILCEEYLAGWFSSFPATHLTPYKGIQSVPPCSFVLVRPDKHTTTRYWDFDPGKRIRYASDQEYEEHFRVVFAEAVQRRLRSDIPVLAELSGGMDSSSIVCVADSIVTRPCMSTPRLDTISYYIDSEPNWNERPYFSKVEEKRGRSGCHIDVSAKGHFTFEHDHLALTPAGIRHATDASKRFEALIVSQGYRVLLSGIGGDEVTGGVPTALPELEDLLARAHFRALAHKLKEWSLNKRRPWFHLLLETVRGFLPPALVGVAKQKRAAPWLNAHFVQRNRAALRSYQGRLQLFGPLPSFQENLSTLDSLRRQLACSALPSDPVYEKRYPYLDRGLMEFMYAVPRDQLVRPGQRRSLMRRALVDIVPDELLNRKRKAAVSRGPRTAIIAEWESLEQVTRHLVSSSCGMVDAAEFSWALQKARHGEQVPIVLLLRTLGIENWLRNLGSRGIVLDVDRPAMSTSS